MDRNIDMNGLDKPVCVVSYTMLEDKRAKLNVVFCSQIF